MTSDPNNERVQANFTETNTPEKVASSNTGGVGIQADFSSNGSMETSGSKREVERHSQQDRPSSSLR